VTGRSQGLSTRCVHAGEIDDAHGSPHTPIYTSTTFRFASTADIVEVVQGRKSAALYTRYGLNPTIRSLEEKLAQLEGAEAALAFCSGMAAESALFLTHGRKGIVCLGDAYGGTLELVAAQLPELGMRTALLLGSESDRLEAELRKGAGLVFFETPTNPGLEIFDIRAIADLAHRHGALVAVDNTFASPANQQPLALGADLVVHSATKYLGGHNDLLCGVVLGSAEQVAPIRAAVGVLGGVPDAHSAYLLLRGLKTLALRMERHNANGMRVARFLEAHPRIRRVWYPGLASHPDHAIAARTLAGFGGVVTFEVDTDLEGCMRFIDACRIPYIAPSLGGVESLIEMPVLMSFWDVEPKARQAMGITDSLVRLSCGVEDADDLIADFEQALRKV